MRSKRDVGDLDEVGVLEVVVLGEEDGVREGTVNFFY